MKKKTLDWIQSGGGPLVCIERGKASQWLGVDGLSVAQNIDRAFSNDYERACGIDDYVGLVELSQGCAIVLGDMPLETRVSYRNGYIPLVVRVFYADKGVDVIKKVEGSEEFDSADLVGSVDVELEGGGIFIFDSAYPYAEVGDAYLDLDVQPGRYRIDSKLLDPDERTSLLIHEFLRID